MKLTLSQQELEQAVRNYVTGMISLQPGTDIGIEFTAGRGEKGITAEVDISYLAVTSIPAIQQASTTTLAAAVSRSSGETSGPATGAAEPASAAASETPPQKDEQKATTRKTTGKTLFGDAKGASGAAASGDAANDAADGTEGSTATEDPSQAAAPAAERKSLFNS